ncbi:MAG: hypothetical protein ACWGOX_03275 [Desulforhopalus sp.]
MSQFIHCFMLLYIVFVMAQIRDVLISGTPDQPEPITIWDEAQPPAEDSSGSLLYHL